MKNFYLYIFLFFALFSKAQYTVTMASAPVAGDVESYLPCDSTGVFPGTAGTSQVWNYTNVVPTSTAVSSATYVPLSSVPNASLFPGATIGAYSGGSSYNVFDYSSSWTYMGVANSSTMFCTPYGDPSTYYTYPFSYGSVSVDTYSYNSSATFNTGNGTVSTVADGTGTLQLPSITYNNVLRIKRSITEVATGASPFTYNGDTYFFYSAASKFPHLVIVTYTVTSGSSTNFNRLVSLGANTVPLGMHESKSVNDICIYPNPVSNDHTVIRFSLPLKENTSLAVYNSLGEAVKTMVIPAGTSEYAVRTEELSKGLYYLKAMGFTCKLIVQ